MIDAFPERYRAHLLRGQRAKLGLGRVDAGNEAADAALTAALSMTRLITISAVSIGTSTGSAATSAIF